MPEAYNESELEQRFKQMTKYVKLGLLSILVLGLILFPYLGNAKQNEIIATQNQQIQAQAAINSDICQVYPDQEFCRLAMSIAEDPDNPVVAEGTGGKDGKDGKSGSDGRGISSFATNSDGDLIVTYTDGKTQNAGRVVGATGSPGENGEDGKGITSSEVIDGNLIIRYTDGTSQSLGVVVGPAGVNGEKGADGANGINGESIEGPPGKDGINGKDGKDGVDGKDGKDGVSITQVATLPDGMVVVRLSDGTSHNVGRIISTTIQSVTCSGGLLTVTMTDGKSESAPVRCATDPLPAPAPPVSEPAPPAPPVPEPIVPTEPQQ